MEKRRILWIDDEIQALGAMVAQLEKDYEVLTATNGDDGLEVFDEEQVDAVILDEQMPGMSGLDVLKEIKSRKPALPVVMFTKSEQPNTEDEALYNGVSGFLTKPTSVANVKSQLRLQLEKDGLVQQKMRNDINANYEQLSSEIGGCQTFADWAKLYLKIVKKECETEKLPEVSEIYVQLRSEANAKFSKFVMENYQDWLTAGKAPESAPSVFSHQILSKVVKPPLENGEKVALVVIDNFRLDQWLVLEQLLAPEYNISVDLYCTILPAATQYSRNAIFAGMTPSQIKKDRPDLWVDQAASLNQHERELLAYYFERQRLDKKNSYYKVGSDDSGEEYLKKFSGYKDNDLNAVVFSFVDALSHTSAVNSVNRELLGSDASYRSVTRTWLEHGVLKRVIDKMAGCGFKIILTTDHGTIRVSKPLDVTGTASINDNMRFKVDKNISLGKSSDPKKILDVRDPARIGLPTRNPSDCYIFATNSDFFVYPNNRNDYVAKFTGTFQHGGISMEEMVLPLVKLTRK